MTLFENSNAPFSDSSSTTTLTEPQPENAPEYSEQPAARAESESPAEVQSQTQTQSQIEDQKTADDFASALESFTTEVEESAGEDHVIHGTVLKLTPTHVFVDIGAKSEGMLQIAEVTDHEGKPRFQPGDAIDVMRDKGETEEGYINLSHQKAQRLRAWDDIEAAYNEKKPIKALVIDRIKGGLT